MCNFAVRKFRDMYAIVEIAGQQFKVTNGQEIFVNRLQGEEGSKVSFDKVLLIDNALLRRLLCSQRSIRCGIFAATRK